MELCVLCKKFYICRVKLIQEDATGNYRELSHNSYFMFT